MLTTLSFSDQQVAKICEDPFKSLNALVEDLNVQVNKAKNKKSHSSVKVTYIISFLLAKSFQFQIPPVDRAREDSVSEELELERSQARSRHGPSVESPWGRESEKSWPGMMQNQAALFLLGWTRSLRVTLPKESWRWQSRWSPKIAGWTFLIDIWKHITTSNQHHHLW